MKKVAKSFLSDGRRILKAAKENGLSPALARERTTLITKIADHCKGELAAQDKATILQNQLRIAPDYMIALEDLTIPVIMLCGLFDPVFDPQAQAIKKFQQVSIDLYTGQRRGDFGGGTELSRVKLFHVLHSFDYASARQAAKEVSTLRPDGVAISFGGAMKSRRWIEQWKLGNRTIQLPEKLPEMYLAVASIALGYGRGNPANTPVHILGVGSPILVALLGLLFRKSRAVSIDSTAPFKDAFQSTIYGSEFGFLKLNMYKVAAYALIDRRPFRSTTPFFKDFEAAHPHRWQKLRTELGVTSTTAVKDLAATLETERDLVEQHIPFFSKMRAGNDQLMKHLRVARAGHNYWILNRICHAIRARKHSTSKLNQWTKYQVEKYVKVANPKWAKAVETVYTEMSGSLP
jgi:hypothetical protein